MTAHKAFTRNHLHWMTSPFFPFPELETERFRLRRLREEDTDAFFGWLSDPEVMRYFGMEPLTERETAAQIIAFYGSSAEKGSEVRWGVEERATGELVGSCGFHAVVPMHRRAEVGFEVRRDRWRTGVMREALPAILRFGFERAGLNRVSALVDPANAASIGLVERLGFTREGVLRQYQQLGGRFDDLISFSLLRSDAIRE